MAGEANSQSYPVTILVLYIHNMLILYYQKGVDIDRIIQKSYDHSSTAEPYLAAVRRTSEYHRLE